MAPTDITWQRDSVSSPLLDKATPVIIARNIAYISNGHRFQTLNVYLPSTTSTYALIGTTVTTLPKLTESSELPHIQVHIHGGAWRDPNLTSTSIEATVAHAFSTPTTYASPISIIISINYTLSPFPAHPTLAYDPIKNNHSDPSREAIHPHHIHDILLSFNFLKNLGLEDDRYILTGHSAGACLAAQASLFPVKYWNISGYEELTAPPRPAALLGMNGLYDLPGLVHDLGSSPEHLKAVYKDLLSIAFGEDESKWGVASPARVDKEVLEEIVKDGKAPKLVVLDQSAEDQLVPMNQRYKLATQLSQIPGLKVVEAGILKGLHATPWEEGGMLWESILNVLEALKVLKDRVGKLVD